MLSPLSFVLIVTASIIVPPTFVQVFAATETDISKLRKDLLRGYDKNSRPVHNHENETTVSVTFYLEGFDWDEENSLFTAQTWILFMWHDEHLKWDPEAYGGLKEVHFADDEIWKPDIYAHNNADKSELDPFIKVQLVVEQRNASSKSTVYWFPSAKFQVGCTANLRAWPYDEQKCRLVLGSWSHEADDINLILAENQILTDPKTYHPNREWDVSEKSIQRRYGEYVPEEYSSVDLLLTFRLKRKSAVHASCLLTPGLVIIIATLVCFWLPPGSRERTSILLLSMIINILFLHHVYKMIPNNGDSVPLVVCFFRDSLVMLVFALLFTVGLRYLANLKREEPVPLPSVITRYVEGLPGKILCLNQRPNIVKPQEGDTGSANEVAEKDKKNSFHEDWAWLAHCLDRIFFLVYLVVYFCMYFALL